MRSRPDQAQLFPDLREGDFGARKRDDLVEEGVGVAERAAGFLGDPEQGFALGLHARSRADAVPRQRPDRLDGNEAKRTAGSGS